MSSYTVLTVFENTDTINEPVISLPMLGKASFRQIGIITGLAVMLPLLIYSTGSESILNAFPNPVFSFVAVNGEIKITWDIVIALVPMPLGLALGIPRPKLVPMDNLIMLLIRFMINHTSVKSTTKAKKSRQPHTKSTLAGFAQDDDSIKPKSARKDTYHIAVTDLGIPKNITITLYDLKGNPIRHKLVRAYIDDDLLSSITTDSDGVIGMTFVPRGEGTKHLKVIADGMIEPIIDAVLDIKRSK